MQIYARIFSQNPSIKILVKNPSKIEQIYFEDIIQENFMQDLS